MVFGPAGELRNFENALCEATAVMTKKEKEREKEDYIRRTQHKQPAIRSASIDTTNAHGRFYPLFLSCCCSGVEISIQKHTWVIVLSPLLPQIRTHHWQVIIWSGKTFLWKMSIISFWTTRCRSTTSSTGSGGSSKQCTSSFGSNRWCSLNCFELIARCFTR